MSDAPALAEREARCLDEIEELERQLMIAKHMVRKVMDYAIDLEGFAETKKKLDASTQHITSLLKEMNQ